MRTRVGITLTLAAAALLAATPMFAEPAQAPANNGFPGCHNPRAIARYLGLTQTQQDQTKALRDTLKQTVEPLRQQIEPLRQQLDTKLAVATPDACAVGATVVQIDGLHDKINTAQDSFEASFEALLTAAQKTKWIALQAVCHAQGETAGS